MKVRVVVETSGSSPGIMGIGLPNNPQFAGIVGGLRVYTWTRHVLWKRGWGDPDPNPDVKYVQAKGQLGWGVNPEMDGPYVLVHPDILPELDRDELAEELRRTAQWVKNQP